MARTQKTPKPQIYLGPRATHLALEPHMIFSDGLPAHLKKMLREHPELKALFVRTSRLSFSLTELKRQGSLINLAYSAAVVLFNSKGR